MVLYVSLLVWPAALMAGCSSDDDAADAQEPTATARNGSPSPAQETPARATSTPSSDSKEPPTFEDGAWTGGSATVSISGVDTRTLSLAIGTRSDSSDSKTRLVYTDNADHSLDFVLPYENVRFQGIVTQKNTSYFVKFPLGDDECDLTYVEASKSRIEATFRCDAELEGEKGGPVLVEGSFTATR